VLPAEGPAARDADPNPFDQARHIPTRWCPPRSVSGVGADSMKHFRAEASMVGRVQGTAPTTRGRHRRRCLRGPWRRAKATVPRIACSQQATCQHSPRLAVASTLDGSIIRGWSHRSRRVSERRSARAVSNSRAAGSSVYTWTEPNLKRIPYRYPYGRDRARSFVVRAGITWAV
jgi:hypothetical protein